MTLPDISAIQAAYEALSQQLLPSPLIASDSLRERGRLDHWLKLENLQPTGSFKVRGALEALRGARRPLITASSGNHGAALAWAAAQWEVPVQVIVPTHAPAVKVERIQRYGAEVIRHGELYDEAEHLARQRAREENLHYLSSFADAAVIAGQGSLAPELLTQLPHPGTLLVPVGGGGLLAGVARWMKSASPQTVVVGVQPAHSCPMALSFYHRRLMDVTHRRTWSDATAGGICTDTLTASLRWVEDILTVSESALEAAMNHFLKEEHLVVEGAGALTLAATLSGLTDTYPTPVIHIVSGGNLDVVAFFNRGKHN